MNIAETLKTHGISKMQFAFDCLMSRPTLDEYILKFESGEQLPKEKYQILFDSLFSQELDEEDFRAIYRDFKKMIRRDKTLNMSDLDAATTDDIILIIDELKEDAKSKEKLLISFFKIILISYRNENPIATNLVLYTNDFNNITNVDATDIQKLYFGGFYHLNSIYRKNPKLIDPKSYDEYSKKKKENLLKKAMKTKEVESQINSVINQYVSEAISDSKEEDDIDTIVNRVLSRLKN